MTKYPFIYRNYHYQDHELHDLNLALRKAGDGEKLKALMEDPDKYQVRNEKGWRGLESCLLFFMIFLFICVIAAMVVGSIMRYGGV